MLATALTVIHKHIRREMFDFSMRLFRAGPHEVAAIQTAFEDVALLLRSHATQEEGRLEPLLKSVDADAAALLLRDHERLEADLEHIANWVRSIDSQSPRCAEALLQLHLDWNRYLAAYLSHIDAEERTWFASLTEHMPLSLIADSAVAQGPEGQKFLDRLWSVTTPSERMAIERGGATCRELDGAAA